MSEPDPGEEPELSLVIPVYNEEGILAESLGSLCERLDAEGIDTWLPRPLRRLLAGQLERLPAWLPAAVLHLAQHRHAAHHQRLRAAMLRAEQTQHRRSTFRGPGL